MRVRRFHWPLLPVLVGAVGCGTSNATGAADSGPDSTSDAADSGSHPPDAATDGHTDSGGSGGIEAAVDSGATDARDAAVETGPTITAPCDIYASGGTPCVAAHSTVRALYAAFNGNLYQVQRASDMATKDIGVLSPGGFADTSTQDSFCAGTTCTVPIIYDQSPQGNHLPVSGVAHWLPEGGVPASASAQMTTVGGHKVYGIQVNGSFAAGDHVAYRNNNTKGVATGDESESMYMVLDGTRYSEWCCFDYGNAETNAMDDGNATMEAIYWGNSTQWASGGGAGPWVAADLENGMYEGDSCNTGGSSCSTPSNTSVTFSYVTAMVKGPSAAECTSSVGGSGCFTLKAGNAQSGTLNVQWDGARPPGYSPQKKQGAIILGTGGDGSAAGTGTFFEGCMTTGNPSDAIDDAVQANIVAAGYGH